MRLAGWNDIPEGYQPWFEIDRAPLWLRWWFRTPVVEKFAYPVAVRRGFGNLTAQPELLPEQLGEVGSDWRVAPDGTPAPSVVTPYRSIARPGALRRRRRRYARAAWRQRNGLGLTLPVSIRLPGGHLVERRNRLFWRIRLPLWVLGGSGALIVGWPGALLGFLGAVVVEMLFSYRRPHGPTAAG